jgi:polar amino acid transport system substrate-binding protein
MDLTNGNLDAVIIDEVVANYQIQVMGLEGYTTIETLSEDLYGIGFRKGDYMLCGAVEEALLDMAQDGTLAEISTKWFGSDVALIGK